MLEIESWRLLNSSQHLLNQSPPHPSKALVQSLVEVRQPCVIEAHQMQNCGVQVGNVARIFHGFETKFVGGADGLASFHGLHRRATC